MTRCVKSTDSAKGNTLYTGNREPLSPSAFIKLPIGAIKPGGWLRKQLELQIAGFHGHLGELSTFLKKDGNEWLDPFHGDHGWEEVPYWLKGYANAAYILEEPGMLKETQFWIDAVLGSQQPDGWFGPESNRTRNEGTADLWPNMIVQFCLQDYYEYSGDSRVVPFLTRYCQHLATIPDEKFLASYWNAMRGGDLLFSVYWLYNYTGDKWLLELAEKVHRRSARWDREMVDVHNVNIAQGFREPATWWMQSKHAADQMATYRNYDTVRELYGQVPGGMFGGDENCRPGYRDPRQAIETCGMVEQMLSNEILLRITGDPVWADRCEDVAFNSLPAALTADLKAIRYLTAPNLIQSDTGNKHPGYQNPGAELWLNPFAHRCCQHNWGHGWPYYAESLWAATPGNGLAALLYAESQVKAKVSDGTEVIITENTRYPFDETVTFTITTEKPVAFPLYLRVPSWCAKAELKLNGKNEYCEAQPLHYIVIEREWTNGDTLTLTLPMDIVLREWTGNHNSISVDRGPLTYSLRIKEKYVRNGGTDEWPAWEIFPGSDWNYGLAVTKDRLEKSFTVLTREWPENDMPFTQEGVPVKLKTTAKKILEWQQDDLGLVGLLPDSPVKSGQPEETVTLIPMGAARLRISSFPVIVEGPTAKQ